MILIGQECLRCTNDSKPKGKQTPAISSSELDIATRTSIPFSSVSREPTHNTSLRMVEMTAPPPSRALPPFAENTSLMSQQRDAATAPEPLQSVVLASLSSHNEGSFVSLPPQWVEEMNADVHPHPGPISLSLQDNVRSPRLQYSRFPVHCSHTQDQCRLPSTKSENENRTSFNPDPVEEVPFIPSPASSTFSLPPSPGPSTPPPLDPAFSSPANPSSPSSYSTFFYHHVYTPSPIPQAYALPYTPPAPLTPGVRLHPALLAPNLQYDVRSPPTHSSPHLSQVILATPASIPPLPSLGLRVGNLPWLFNVLPNIRLSPGNSYVTVQDVLLAIYYHLRTAVKSAEYEVMSKSRKAEIFREFERRVGSDPVQRGKGLRRVDFLNGRLRAEGLVRNSKDSVWEVIIH